LWLIKTDAAGNKVWDRTLGGDYGSEVRRTQDGGYIVAGVTYPSGAPSDAWLVKTDETGNKVWDKSFGGGLNDRGYSAQQTSDGGHIVAGTYSLGLGDFDVWLIKTDSVGNQVWDQMFGGTGGDWGWTVQQTSDGGYVVVSTTESYGAGSSDAWLIKTDSVGHKVWDETYGGSGEDNAYSVQQTSDGGYIIVGSTRSAGAGGSDVWLTKTDSMGKKVWDRTFGGKLDDGASSVQQTSDGGYVIAGETQSLGAGDCDAWLIRADGDGNEVWDMAFGGSDGEYGSCVQQTSDGGYVMVATTCSCGAGSADVWLIKVDAEGVQDDGRGKDEFSVQKLETRTQNEHRRGE
jgi:predicted secreted protein